MEKDKSQDHWIIKGLGWISGNGTFRQETKRLFTSKNVNSKKKIVWNFCAKLAKTNILENGSFHKIRQDGYSEKGHLGVIGIKKKWYNE